MIYPKACIHHYSLSWLVFDSLTNTKLEEGNQKQKHSLQNSLLSDWYDRNCILYHANIELLQVFLPDKLIKEQYFLACLSYQDLHFFIQWDKLTFSYQDLQFQHTNEGNFCHQVKCLVFSCQYFSLSLLIIGQLHQFSISFCP